jgi:sn-glycerol 3-phosphate transport system ATP-binding protein
MARVELSGLKKTYPNGFKAIHGVDVDIADGEFIVLVGPSGCGKSTLLRMIAGLESITEGTARIGERVVNDLEPADRDIAMVFQNYALYPHMNVFDNMAYGLKIRKLPKDEIRQRVQKAADILEIAEYLTRSPRQLSGGQRQRVAMGRAIVREPSVFLFDEPLSNLDAKLRVSMRLEIKTLQERLGTTSVYVTHDQVEAMTLGHRLMVLNDGVVEQIGTPIDIYERPRTPFVAGFIGSPAMNFLSAKVATNGRKAELANGDSIPLPAKLPDHANREIMVGIRPEDLQAGQSQAGQSRKGKGKAGKDTAGGGRTGKDGAKFSSFVVQVVELLGADTIVHGTLGKGGAGLTVRLRGVRATAQGEALPLAFAPEHLHLFDPDSGQRLN